MKVGAWGWLGWCLFSGGWGMSGCVGSEEKPRCEARRSTCTTAPAPTMTRAVTQPATPNPDASPSADPTPSAMTSALALIPPPPPPPSPPPSRSDGMSHLRHELTYITSLCALRLIDGERTLSLAEYAALLQVGGWGREREGKRECVRLCGYMGAWESGLVGGCACV